MRNTLRTAGIIVVCLWPASLGAQDAPKPPPRPGCCMVPPPLRVFMDCHTGGCDGNFLREEFPFLDFMRDRLDADVQVIVTEEETGGGGSEFTLTFLGHQRFAGRIDTLKAFTRADATDDDERRVIAQQLGLGLARYLAAGPSPGRFALRYTAPAGGAAVASQAARDPWDYWAFRASTNVGLNGEKSYHFLRLNGSLGATRITPTLKVEMQGWGSKNRSESIYRSDTTASDSLDNPVELTDVTENRTYGGSVLFAPSLGRHWAWATYVELSRNSFENQAMEVDLRAGLEYDIWPYDEVSRRLFTIRGYGGLKSFRYDEETIYNETAETRPVAALEFAVDATQPWGSVGADLESSIYLHDLSKNREELSGELSVRLVRGLSLNMWGEVASIHDQLGLRLSEVDPLDVVARRRELATNYSYYTSIGFSYHFGSAFNNVVNPRFR